MPRGALALRVVLHFAMGLRPGEGFEDFFFEDKQHVYRRGFVSAFERSRATYGSRISYYTKSFWARGARVVPITTKFSPTPRCQTGVVCWASQGVVAGRYRVVASVIKIHAIDVSQFVDDLRFL